MDSGGPVFERIAWSRQGVALVGLVPLADGRHGTIVLAGSPDNEKGAVLVLASASGGNPQTLPFNQAINLLQPRYVVDILCVQERSFGHRGLPAANLPVAG